MIKLRINGQEVTAERGATVLDAAKAHGIRIPNLCAAEGLTSYGGCRLCLAEIKGRKGYVPACCTPVEENLEVITDTPELRKLRQLTLELILSEHPHACLICAEKTDCEEYKSTIRKVNEVTGCVLCPKNGQCRLQEVVEEIKIERVRFPASYRNFEVLRDDPFFDRNYNLCILCARCVRVCSEVRGAAALTIVFRGPQAVIGTALDRPLLDSGCEFCGACVDVCPTGALTERALKGERLPDETRRTICPLCSVGCSLEVGLRKGRIVGSRPLEGAAVNDGQACVKGRFMIRDVVHSPKRALRPMIRGHNGLEEVSWDEALEAAAQRLTAGQPESSAMAISSQLSLEDLYIAGKFSRAILNTDPVLATPVASPLLAYWEALRENEISAPLNFNISSLSEVGAVVVLGTDLPLTHPIIWLNVLKAVRRGAKLVLWDPGPASPIRWATRILRTTPGSELAVLSHLGRRLLEQRPKGEPVQVPGFNEFEHFLHDVTHVEGISPTGVSDQEIRSLAGLLYGARPGVFLCGAGILTRSDAGVIVRMLWNVAQLLGARVVPLPLESNERGAVELWPWGLANAPSLDSIVCGLESGRIKSLYLAGGFPFFGRKRPDALIVQDCYRTEFTGGADVILPAATWAETDGTFVNIEGRIQKFKRALEPIGEARPDWWIFCRLAEKLGRKDFAFQSPLEIAEEIGRMLPALREADSAHSRKGRPSFVFEEKKLAGRFLPFGPPVTPATEVAGHSLEGSRQRLSDFYRGLDLCQEVKGFRRLREKLNLRDEKTKA